MKFVKISIFIWLVFVIFVPKTKIHATNLRQFKYAQKANFSKEIFAMIGHFSYDDYDFYEELVESNGAKLLDRLTDEATIIFTGESPDVLELCVAESHNIPVIPENWFLDYADNDIDPRTRPGFSEYQHLLFPSESSDPVLEESSTPVVNTHANFCKEVFAATGATSFDNAPCFGITIKDIVEDAGAKVVRRLSEDVTLLVMGDFPEQSDLDYAARHNITVIPSPWLLVYLDNDIDPRTIPGIEEHQPPMPPDPEPTPEVTVIPTVPDKYPTYYENPFAHIKSALLAIASSVALLTVFILSCDTGHAFTDLLSISWRIPIAAIPLAIWGIVHGIRSSDDPK